MVVRAEKPARSLGPSGRCAVRGASGGNRCAKSRTPRTQVTMTGRVGMRKVGKERRHRGCRGHRPLTAVCGGGDGRLRYRKQWYSRYLRARQTRLLGEPLRIRRRFLCTCVRGRISVVARLGFGFEAIAARRAGDHDGPEESGGRDGYNSGTLCDLS